MLQSQTNGNQSSTKTDNAIDELQKFCTLSAKILAEGITFFEREADTFTPVTSYLEREKNVQYLWGKLSVYVAILSLITGGEAWVRETHFIADLAERVHLANDLDL